MSKKYIHAKELHRETLKQQEQRKAATVEKEREKQISFNKWPFFLATLEVWREQQRPSNFWEKIIPNLEFYIQSNRKLSMRTEQS